MKKETVDLLKMRTVDLVKMGAVDLTLKGREGLMKNWVRGFMKCAKMGVVNLPGVTRCGSGGFSRFCTNRSGRAAHTYTPALREYPPPPPVIMHCILTKSTCIKTYVPRHPKATPAGWQPG